MTNYGYRPLVAPRHPALEALDRYLDYRTVRRMRRTADSGRYRGFGPASKLILMHKEYQFHLNTKRRSTWAGDPVDYLACDSLQSHVTKLPRCRHSERFIAQLSP